MWKGHKKGLQRNYRLGFAYVFLRYECSVDILRALSGMHPVAVPLSVGLLRIVDARSLLLVSITIHENHKANCELPNTTITVRGKRWSTCLWCIKKIVCTYQSPMSSACKRQNKEVNFGYGESKIQNGTIQSLR